MAATSTDVPHYKELLAFLNLRAQASESSSAEPPKKVWKNEVRGNRKSLPPGKPIASFAATADSHCILCKVDRHPLYACSKFKILSHEQKMSTLKGNRMCVNCLGDHPIRQCKSLHRCKRCQKSHHTLLHKEVPSETPSPLPAANDTGVNDAAVGSFTPLPSGAIGVVELCARDRSDSLTIREQSKIPSRKVLMRVMRLSPSSRPIASTLSRMPARSCLKSDSCSWCCCRRQMSDVSSSTS